MKTEATAELPAEREIFPTARQFFGALLIYFTLQIILRVCISSSLDLDESEQLVLTQKLSLGYGSQPPLYTWIQFGFFKIFGLSVFALSLLKNILLFCTYLFTYLNVRFITRNHLCAVAGALALLFIPQIAWESQRDLTHSVLSATFACVTLYCFLRLSAKSSLANYAWFGLCGGLGVLSKYNFALVFVALTLAAASVPRFRTLVLDRRMALAILIAAAVILPNAYWAVQHRDLALRSVGKFNIQQSGHWLSAVVTGLKGLAMSTVTFFAALAVIYGIIFWKRPALSAPAEKNEYATLLVRMLGFSYGLMALAIVLFRISEVRDRWLQPILITSPALVMVFLKPRMNPFRLKWILSLAVVIMVAVTAGLHGRILLAEKWHRTQPWNRPYDALAKPVKAFAIPGATVVTDTTLLAGNLRMNIPDKIFTTPELSGLFVEPTNTYFALVWDAGGDAVAGKSTRGRSRDWPPPDNLADFARRTGIDLDPAAAQYFSAIFKYHRSRQMKLGFLMSGVISTTER